MQSMRTFLIWAPAVLLPAVLMAQTPAAAPAPATQGEIQVRYEPGTPSPLPIQTCEVQTKIIPHPHTVKLPAHVKMYLYDERTLEQGALVFDRTLTEPMKLDRGYYVFEVEGQTAPIYVAYDIKDVWQTYIGYKEPEHSNLGNFFIPGFARLPTGQYSVKGARFDLPIECRNKERAVIEIPTFDGLPPFLAPAPGISW